MTSVDFELALVGLAAMLEPATILASVLALVLSDRPLRTGWWFYLGGFGTTLAVGVLAAFVIGDSSASTTSTPKKGVSVAFLIAGTLLLVYVALLLLRPADDARDQIARTTERMSKVASAPPLAIVVAGAALANPGLFMLIALTNISQLNPSTAQFVLDWILFALVALLPLGVALLLLLVKPGWTAPFLKVARGWIERHARTIVAIVLAGLAAALLRDGIAGLT